MEEVRRGGQTAERFGISPKQKLWAKKRNSCAALRGQAAPKISHGSKRAGRRRKKPDRAAARAQLPVRVRVCVRYYMRVGLRGSACVPVPVCACASVRERGCACVRVRAISRPCARVSGFCVRVNKVELNVEFDVKM